MNKGEQSISDNLAIKSGSAYMVSTILLSSSSIITAPIFSRLLTTSDYGIVSNFMAWQSIGLIIIGLGLAYTIGNAKIDFPSDFNGFLYSIQALSSLVGLIAFIIAILFVNHLSSLLELDASLVIAIFMYLLFLPSVIYMQEKYKFFLEYKKSISISFFNTIGSIFICLILIKFVFTEHKYFGRILGLILPMFLLGLYYYYSILRRGWGSRITKYWRYALGISLPFIPHTLGMVVLTQLDRIMITKMLGNSDTGLYSFGVAYASIFALASNAIAQAFQPWLYQNYSENNMVLIKKAANTIVLGISFLIVLIVAFGPEVIKLLGPENFWDSKYVIMPVVVGSFFQFLAAIYSSIQLYHKKTYFIPVGTLLSALVNIGLNLILIPILGIKGAAFGLLLSFLVQSLFHMVIYKRVAKSILFDDGYMWRVTGYTVVSSYLIFLVYDLVLLRFLITLFVILLLYLFQKRSVDSLLLSIWKIADPRKIKLF